MQANQVALRPDCTRFLVSGEPALRRLSAHMTINLPQLYTLPLECSSIYVAELCCGVPCWLPLWYIERSDRLSWFLTLPPVDCMYSKKQGRGLVEAFVDRRICQRSIIMEGSCALHLLSLGCSAPLVSHPRPYNRTVCLWEGLCWFILQLSSQQWTKSLINSNSHISHICSWSRQGGQELAAVFWCCWSFMKRDI
jgi:hypothetical protein